MIKKLLKKFIPAGGPVVDLDDNISANIKKFQQSISKPSIKNYSRSENWEKKIEVVVPCFNHAPYLKAAFRSIADQSYKGPLSVTFINDASTDNSLEVMNHIKKRNSDKRMPIKVINNASNPNQAASINKAAKESRNELIVILNADDLLTPDCLDLIIATYKNNPDIAMLGGSSLWFEKDKKLPKFSPEKFKEFKIEKIWPKDAAHFTKLNDINMSQSSCSFFKAAWELVGGYFEKDKRVCSYDDRDFQMRVCSVLPIGIYEDYPMEFYRVDSSQGRATV